MRVYQYSFSKDHTHRSQQASTRKLYRRYTFLIFLFMDLFEITHKAREIVNACKAIYGERWEERKKQIREDFLVPHHEKYKTTNLLSSAIRLSENQTDQRLVLVLI